MTSFIQKRYDLQSCNTMALPAVASYYCCADSNDKILGSLQFAKENDLPVYVLGGGSNVIFSGDYDGLVINVATTGVRVVKEGSESLIVSVAAGEDWDGFLKICMSNGWYGLENLAIIPGTVGAAPIQNIGAYGQEVAQHILEVHCIDRLTFERQVFSASDCEFSYRDSVFKGIYRDKYIITDVVFTLSKSFSANVKYKALSDYIDNQGVGALSATIVREAVINIRQSKLPEPSVLANTGSFFKNPIISSEKFHSLSAEYPDMPAFQQESGDVKLAAGWLIEQCGWKGKSLGPVGMYERQALVLVNHGGATYADLEALISAVRADVRSKFSVELEQEPILI